MGKILEVTMADVGRAAGVSQTAVSLAFRRDPSIPAETRKRILSVARRLGYRPHAAISALMAQVRARKPVTVKAELAAITHWAAGTGAAGNPTWQQQWLGARRRAEELGYALEEFCLGDGKLTARRLASILRSRNIDGLVVFPLVRPQAMEFGWEKFSATAIGYTLEAPPLHRVVTAHFDAVLIALRQLHDRGYGRIGLVLDEDMNQRVRRNWQAAFCAHALEHGTVEPDALITMPAANAAGHLRAWLERYRPEAVLCGSLFPIRSWLVSHGQRVPEDIGIVGLAKILPGEGCACIDEKWEEVGAAAVDMLVGQLHRGERGVPSRQMLTLIRGEWVDGDSVRPTAMARR